MSCRPKAKPHHKSHIHCAEQAALDTHRQHSRWPNYQLFMIHDKKYLCNFHDSTAAAMQCVCFMGKPGGDDDRGPCRLKLQLLQSLFLFNSQTRAAVLQKNQGTAAEFVRASALPGQQAVVSGVVVILEVDHIQLRVVILTGLRQRTEVWMWVIKYSFCGNYVLGMLDGPKGAGGRGGG